MTDHEFRRQSREFTERIFRDGLIRTFIEIGFIAVVGGLGCIYAVLLFWEYVVKPLVVNGWIN